MLSLYLITISSRFYLDKRRCLDNNQTQEKISFLRGKVDMKTTRATKFLRSTFLSQKCLLHKDTSNIGPVLLGIFISKYEY